MDISPDLIYEALDHCATEPVHMPGTIQPAGAVLAVDANSGAVVQVSANIQSYLGLPPTDVLGRTIPDLLGTRVAHDIRNAQTLSSFAETREPVGTVEVHDRHLQVSAFATGSFILCELEDFTQDDTPADSVLREIERMTNRMHKLDDLQDLLEKACWMLQALTGYDRVMAYQFDAEYNGEILAESLNGPLEPLLGFRFPKWDIPRQARDIMLRVPVRFICDVDQDPVPILSQTTDMAPLDITLANTRGVSPVHIHYLQNMGTKATMTLSLVVDDRLWGMFSFHHASPRVPSPRIRDICIAIGKFFGLKLAVLQKDNDLRVIDRVDKLRRDLQDRFSADQSMTALLSGLEAYLFDLFSANGMVDQSDVAPVVHGNVPSQPVIDAISEAARQNNDLVWAADNITERFDHLDAEAFCGVGGALYVQLPDNRFLALFRDQRTRTISWAGAPDKQIDIEDGMARLSPRGSFELYLQTLEHLSDAWTPQDIQLAESLLSSMISAERRMLDAVRARQSLMIDELNHRVRNILALIRSVSHQARKSHGSLDSYRNALEQRINALAAAHDIGSGHGVDSISLRRLITIETTPYVAESRDRVSVVDCDYWIAADKAPFFALLLHELATNAAKYGALSVPDGHLHIAVTKHEDGITLRWREVGGPRVVEPKNRGFGSILIENAVPYELGGTSELVFDADGVRAEMWIPSDIFVASPEAGTLDKSQIDVLQVDEPAKLNLPSGAILLVEDNFMLVLDLTDMLEELGAQTVVSAANVPDALRLIAQNSPYFAILDVNLSVAGGTSEAVAVRLRELGIPFVFATGYGKSSLMGLDFDVPILTKPISATEMIQVLRQFEAE